MKRYIGIFLKIKYRHLVNISKPSYFVKMSYHKNIKAEKYFTKNPEIVRITRHKNTYFSNTVLHLKIIRYHNILS